MSPIYDTVFLDTSWPPSSADTFIYAVEAIYTAGMAEKTISNKLIGTTVGLSEISADEINVYPNPATDLINIVKAGDARIELFNYLGQLMQRKEYCSDEIIVNVSSCVPGNYFLRIVKENKVITKKIQVL